MAKKRRSKRDTYVPPEQPKPPPTPKWVPYTGVGLIGVGALTVVVAYLAAWSAWIIFGGFVAMAAGLVTLSQWR